MHSPRSFLLAGLCVLLLASSACGFYLPGVKEKYYDKSTPPRLEVNKLTSEKTQLPYDYYKLPFCKPKIVQKEEENLGELLRGDKIEDSIYEISTLEPVNRKVLNKHVKVDNPDQCTHYDQKHLKQFTEFIKDLYKIQWVMDNLPAATVKQAMQGDHVTRYEPGFLIGEEVKTPEGVKVAINNHVDIKIIYGPGEEKAGEKSIVILALQVTPRSLAYDFGEWNAFSDAEKIEGKAPGFEGLMYIDASKEYQNILWSYSVEWEENLKVKWSERWDVYLQNTGAQIHWISIVNSLMIVLFLTGMVAMIMMRTLRADLRRYNQQDLSDDEGETGWKLVHGDVFRPPRHPMALAVLIGSGVQVFGMAVITLLFAVLGFLSPAQRGMLIIAFITLFVVMGVFAGYFSTRCYKMFKGVHWKKNTVNTAFAFPGTCFVIYFILDLFEWHAGSSSAVPFSVILSLVALWFGISVPLVFFGSYFAQRKPLPEDPVRTNQIPRQIPEQVWYMSPVLSVLMGGILPFGAVFIELFFILSALWVSTQLYYIFGFLFIVFVILIVTCAEITVVMCYFQLCAEDYNWWWRSFLTSGASAFYMFLYSVFYFTTSLHIEKFTSAVLYFGYTLIMTIAFFVLTGSIGFYACYYFVRTIYSSIHVD